MTSKGQAQHETGVDPMGKYFTIFKRALGGYGSNNDSSFAAAISYQAIFSIFPLILFVIAFIGFFFHSASQRQQVVNWLFSVLGSSVSKDSLRSQVNAVAGGSAGLGIFGIIAALWGANGVFDQIRTALQNVWGSTHSRPYVQTQLVDLAMVFSVGLLVLLSLVATGVLTAIQGFSTKIFGSSIGPGLHVLFAIAYIVIPAAISFLAFSILYWFVPHAEIRFKDVWLGAAVAAALFEVVQLLFAWYAASFGHYSQTYGTLGGIIAFLFFIYLSANIILLGGEVAKEYIDVMTGVKPEAEPEQPQAKQTLVQKAEGFVKGLFVDTSPHHDTSLPYEPGREEPATPGAKLVKNDRARSEVKQFQQGNAPASSGGNQSQSTNGHTGNGEGNTQTRGSGRSSTATSAAKPRGADARQSDDSSHAEDDHAGGDGGAKGGEQRRWHGDPRRTRDPNADKHNNRLPLP